MFKGGTRSPCFGLIFSIGFRFVTGFESTVVSGSWFRWRRGLFFGVYGYENFGNVKRARVEF